MSKRRENEKKHKIIRKGKESTIIEFNLSKAVILLIIIGVIIAGILTKEIVTTIIETNQTELLANEEGIDVQDLKKVNGDLGYITSVEASEVKTGVGPFDADDEPGNDSSEENNIVRSFDQITWTYELTFGLKPGTTETSLRGGIIEVEASLPEDLANIVEWDLDSMLWLEEANISEDGMNLTGKYTMSDEEITIPGKTNVVFVLQVKNATQGTEIQPTFKFKLSGNEDNEVITKTAEKVKVSSTGKYNIQLARNGSLENKTTVDYGQGETPGRMYGYGFTVQLYNDNESKGIKGLECPKGEISFDIDLKLERSLLGSEELEDITDEATPILWNYRVNKWGTNDISGEIDSRNMYCENYHDIFDRALPLGIDTGDRRYSVYDSGNIKIIQEGSILHVTVNNYKFDEEYPQYNCQWETATMSSREKIYTDNIGTFSVGYMQIFVPDTPESTIEGRNYYLTVSDNNVNIICSSGQTINSQMKTTDDIVSTQHVIYKKGSYNHSLSLDNPNGEYIGTNYGSGDGKAAVGDIIRLGAICGMNPSNDYDIYTANKFVKFDGNAFEPVYYDNGNKYNYTGQGNTEFKVWYVTKKDGTNWTSQEEMNNGNIEDMDIYENIKDIPENKICVGIYLETIDGYIAKRTGDDNRIYLLVKIKETAEIGKTYGLTQRTWYWKEELDRSVYTITNKDIKYLEDWPETEWDSGNLNYIKTEYDENGQMVAGTHSGGAAYGNTVLVIGANLHGAIRAIDSNKADKVNYDLGKNEDKITYSLEPQLDGNPNLVMQIEDVVLKAEVTLPKGLEYVPGSSKRGEESYNEPEIKENDDESTILVWYIYGVASGQEIEPILFEAEIDKRSTNGTQYETTFVISEEVGSNEISKIGNSEVGNRTPTESINIINLASFRLYKEVETSVIEKNGEIHYTITGRNNTNIILPEFALLDIMPYNGDNRGTKFNGTYTISRITISQNINEAEVENTNLKLYISQDEQVKNITVKDTNLGTSSIWEEVQETNGEYIINKEQANDGITGIAIKGELVGQTETITKLNSSSNLKLEENNVNAGLLKKINLEFIKVAEENHENTIGGTEFKLYKLNCTEHEEGYHDNEQIDTSNVNSCWELVGTEESSSNKENEGKVEFKDLQLEEEYRLVETKASINRIKPDGQWKIELVYIANGEDNGNNENSESTGNNQDITINGNIGIQITAIGNPPGFIKENGELLLPNRAYFEFPTSGSIGTKTIYQIGITIILVGTVLFISRKHIFIKSKSNKKVKNKYNKK